MKISDLKFNEHLGGIRAEVHFNNGYGASIVSGSIFFTCDNKPYELAVIKDDALCYDTPITDDVLGYLTVDDVERVLDEIAALPAVK